MVSKLHYFISVLKIIYFLQFTIGEQSQSCGQRSAVPLRRIVNGNSTTIQEWPWMVGLLLNGKLVCGGSLVSHNVVVTAAHCLYVDSDVTHWKAIVGQHNIRSPKTTDLASFTIHPLFVYNGPKYEKPCDYDIAVIKLSSIPPGGSSISTGSICLLPQGTPFSLKKNCYVTGWGRGFTRGPQFDTLQEITVDLVPQEVCNDTMSYNGTIHDNAICAGPETGGTGPCQFDSGGPLTCEVNGLWYLIGIISFGSGCARPFKYGVYSNMFKLTSWVEEKLRTS